MQACRLSLAEVTHPAKVVKKRKLKLPQKQNSRRAGGAPYDRGVRKEGQVAEGAVVFLATMPARGGCRTVIRAWSREGDSSFSRSLVEVKDTSKALKFSEGLGKRAAAVLDLPHGFAVKIAASVNVFVVHSASAGKIWVMAAKLKQVDEESPKLSENSTESKQFAANLEGLSGKLAGASLKVEGLNGIRSNLEQLRSSGGCRHMIIGEENGVRVWALRPLVKGRSKKRAVVGEKCKEGLIVNKFEDLDKGNRQLSCVESGLKAGGLDQGSSLESDMLLCSAPSGRKLGALSELNLQTNTIEGYLQLISLENGKLEALDQLNLQASFFEGNGDSNSMYRGRALDHLNLQANSVESNLQLNSMENGKTIKDLNGASVENDKEETCLVKGGKKAIVGEELMVDNFAKECNVEINGKEPIVLNGGERVNIRGVHVGKVCEKINERQASPDLGEKNLDGGKEAELSPKKLLGNGIIEDTIGANGKGSGDAVANSVNGVQCKCTNIISQGATEMGFEVGNLANGNLRQCEAKCFSSKRRNGQLYPNTTTSDDSSMQQQFSQKSSSSSAASSFSGSVAPRSVSISARASSTLGSTNSSEGTFHAPVSSMLGKCRSSLKMRDTSGKVCSFFVPFEDTGKEGNKASRLRAIAIHALSQTKFVVLDSAGDLHILSLHNLVSTIDGQKEQDCVTVGHCCLRHLKCSLKVNMLATFPETSSTTSQKLWASDGRNSIHLLSFPNVSTSLGGSDKDPVDENPLQLSVMQAVFLSDRIRAIASMSANATLVLTQGSIITYAIAGTELDKKPVVNNRRMNVENHVDNCSGNGINYNVNTRHLKKLLQIIYEINSTMDMLHLLHLCISQQPQKEDWTRLTNLYNGHRIFSNDSYGNAAEREEANSDLVMHNNSATLIFQESLLEHASTNVDVVTNKDDKIVAMGTNSDLSNVERDIVHTYEGFVDQRLLAQYDLNDQSMVEEEYVEECVEKNIVSDWKDLTHHEELKESTYVSASRHHDSWVGHNASKEEFGEEVVKEVVDFERHDFECKSGKQFSKAATLVGQLSHEDANFSHEIGATTLGSINNEVHKKELIDVICLKDITDFTLVAGLIYNSSLEVKSLTALERSSQFVTHLGTSAYDSIYEGKLGRYKIKTTFCQFRLATIAFHECSLYSGQEGEANGPSKFDCSFWFYRC
ncbi:hypothetical protein SUGI_0080920 [Cryptomeria japonica]|nr:hypothetical protein SUGI_0080920 [Cryptomeria japonica]